MEMINKRLENLPDEYKNSIDEIIEDAKEIYKDNLKSIFLAGSTGKGNCIKNWSDIDIYVISNKFDLNQNLQFYTKMLKYDIHVGTTFYTVDMIKNIQIDEKTKVSFYEYNNYGVNVLVYGDLDIPNIEFSVISSGESLLDNMIQTVQRELFIYRISNKNFKTLIKKTSLLIRVYLECVKHIFVFGYSDIFQTFNIIENIHDDYDIREIIKNNDDQKKISKIVENILKKIINRRNENMKRICARGLIVTDKGLSVIYRKKVDGNNVKEYYVIPGGGIEENEEIVEGLKRELREELDIEVNVKDLAFVIESDDRIEYFYNCEFVSGNFKLNGEELERMSAENYYEPTFIKMDELNDYQVMNEVKKYYNK